MSTEPLHVYREIQAILGRCFSGISMSSLSTLETKYHQVFKTSLDYNSSGVNSITELLDKMHDKGMVVFFQEPQSKMTHVVCARMVKNRQKDLKHKVQQLLDARCGSIPLIDFEASYKCRFKKKLDYRYFFLKDFHDLCIVLNLVVEAADSGGDLVIKAAKINNLRNMSTNSSDVYQEILKILGSCFPGIPESHFSCLEGKYRHACKRSLDYNTLGVTDIVGLLCKMHDEGMVVFSEEPKTQKTYVMCARALKSRQENLKLIVQDLLDANDGEIPLIDFEVAYMNRFKVPLDYHYYGLKDFLSLCEVLELVVEAGNFPGDKVVKLKFSDVYRDIRKLLGSCILGIPTSSLSCLEREYMYEFKRSLDYNSLGVTNIKELLDKMRDRGMVLFSEELESNMKYVMCARTLQNRQKNLKLIVRALFDELDGVIPVSVFEIAYMNKFEVELDYHYFGLKNFDSLCKVLNLVVEEGNVPGEEVVKKAGKINSFNMSEKSSDVYQEIQKILGSCILGIPMSSLSCLEREYIYQFKRSLDYNSLGVNNIEGLLNKMHDKGMVVFSEVPESIMTNVMCSRTLQNRQKNLKLIVQELLDENDGEIPLIDFEVAYKNKFEVQLDYHYFGLKDFYSVCEVLNLVVEAGNSGGEVVKVKKAPRTDNLRKRKKVSSPTYEEDDNILLFV